MVNLFNKKRNEKEAAEAEAAKKLAESQAKAEAAREKLKAEAAQKEADAAKQAAEKAKQEADKARAEAAVLKSQQEAAKAKAEEEARKAQWDADKKAREEAAAAKAAAVVKHTWTNEDTYSSLAFKHYGSIEKPYWWLIYEHNKHLIGDNPNSIKTGTVIEIPPLPEELKKKK